MLIKCTHCSTKADYNERYDAEYCRACNCWLIDKCKDEKCFFCTKRPEKPLFKKKNDKAHR